MRMADGGCVALFKGWRANLRARRMLRCCAALDPRFVKDIGLTPAEIADACGAPFWRPPSFPQSQSATGEASMRDVTRIIDDYLAVWNEPDPQERRRRIGALWAPDGNSCYRLGDAHGCDAIEARVTGSWEKWLRDGRYAFRPRRVRQHHDVVKFDWVMVALPEGRVEANGLSFLVLDPNGRIDHDFQFNPSAGDAADLAAHYLAAAVEAEPERRRTRIAELWAPDAVCLAEDRVARGRPEIEAALAEAQGERAAKGVALSATGRSQAHHDVAWFECALSGGEQTTGAISHLLIRDAAGQVRFDCGFVEREERP